MVAATPRTAGTDVKGPIVGKTTQQPPEFADTAPYTVDYVHDCPAPVEAAFRTRLREWAAGLAATRPTAVNLRWALERMLARADRTAPAAQRQTAATTASTTRPAAQTPTTAPTPTEP